MDIWKITKNFAKGFKEVTCSISKFLFKAIIFILVIGYIILGIGSLDIVIRREYIRHKNPAYIKEIINRAALTNRFEELDKWLTYRPLDEVDYTIDVMGEKSSYLNPSMFFRIAGIYNKLEKREEALFWFYLGKYRMMYDLMRCGAEDAIFKIDNIISITHDVGLDNIEESLENKQIEIKNILKRVVEYDKKYPPLNDIESTCKVASHLEGDGALYVVEESEWPEIRSKLMNAAEEFVNSKD